MLNNGFHSFLNNFMALKEGVKENHFRNRTHMKKSKIKMYGVKNVEDVQFTQKKTKTQTKKMLIYLHFSTIVEY